MGLEVSACVRARRCLARLHFDEQPGGHRPVRIGVYMRVYATTKLCVHFHLRIITTHAMRATVSSAELGAGLMEILSKIIVVHPLR